MQTDNADINHTPPTLLWTKRICIPFSYALSKNQMFTRRKNGQVTLRRESRTLRTQITQRIKAVLYQQRVAHNKVWIDIFVEKPDHRGDAVNVVDLICDALKDALPVDDRWYCIRLLDWQINKSHPQIHIVFGQASDEDCQVCSQCGAIKTLDHFHKSKRSSIGVGYLCKTCRQSEKT